ncbi:unnamed protein product [Cuscuta epithymum]|uniref:Uncharacterized protein n=1 Tax=Cuscuta epithymum TaxID=186058 RepID=A0AAV0FFQ0_9ASTE|nr:unnamed protein product [Cuscuta epithymum]
MEFQWTETQGVLCYYDEVNIEDNRQWVDINAQRGINGKELIGPTGPKHSGPSVKKPTVRIRGAFGTMAEGSRSHRTASFEHTKLLGENGRNQEPSAPPCPWHRRSLRPPQALGCPEPSATGKPSANSSIIEDSLWRQATTTLNAASRLTTAFNAVHM